MPSLRNVSLSISSVILAKLGVEKARATLQRLHVHARCDWNPYAENVAKYAVSTEHRLGLIGSLHHPLQIVDTHGIYDEQIDRYVETNEILIVFRVFQSYGRNKRWEPPVHLQPALDRNRRRRLAQFVRDFNVLLNSFRTMNMNLFTLYLMTQANVTAFQD